MNASRTRTVRIAVGGVVTAATIAVATLLVIAQPPARAVDTVSVTALPGATTSTASCVGPLLTVGRDATRASALSDAAQQRITSGATDGRELEQFGLAAPDVDGGQGSLVFSAAPNGEQRTDLAVAGSAQLSSDDLAGFAASACARAQMDSWLVGGSGTTGAADVVVLSNPGDVPALANLSVYGATGLTRPPAGANIVVPARTQRVVALAALALGEDTPVIRVTSSQAPVQSALQTSLTRVLDPVGVDQVVATGAPQNTIVIPGVPVTVAPGESGASEVPTSLRLLAPASDGTATITVQGGSGMVGEARDVALVAGVPISFDFSELAVGTYTVSVTATTPVTGAVRARSGFGAGSDFGWFTPSESMAQPTLFAVAAGPSPILTLASTSAVDQTVTVSSAEGADARDVTVTAGGTAQLTLTAGAVYLLSPSEEIRAAVTFSGRGAIAGYPVAAGDSAAAAIVVYPR